MWQQPIGGVVLGWKLRQGGKMKFDQLYRGRVASSGDFGFDATEVGRRRTEIYVEVLFHELLR